jgi:hypothetical protein
VDLEGGECGVAMNANVKCEISLDFGDIVLKILVAPWDLRD